MASRRAPAKPRPQRKRRETRGARNIRWLETYCRIPEGPLVGQLVQLAPFQKRDLKRIYDNRHGTRRAILSFGRKNAKTALCAMLLLLHLAGPEAVANGQLYSAAQSREQAAVLFSLAAKMVRMSPELSAVVRIRDMGKELLCDELGTRYRALSAEASTAHGLSPVFIVHDELGQVRGSVSPLYEALETATAGQANPLSMIISTQSPRASDLLSLLIDDALTGADPRTVISLYTAPLEDEEAGVDPFSAKHIKKANPAFDIFQNKAEVLAMAEAARRMPSREAEFRNLVLNQRVEMRSPFIARGPWMACAGAVDPRVFDDGAPVYGGLDLSAVSDLTARVFIAADEEDTWHVDAQFWLPEEGLIEKSRTDREKYDVWNRQGFLNTTPGRTINYAFVAHQLWHDCQRWNVRKIGFDDWGFAHLKPYLLEAGFREDQIEGDDALFEPLRQGFRTMSPALRDLEADILERRLRHGGHPVLLMCSANAIVTSDPAGNRKLDKGRATGRIDGMVALAMARAVAATDEHKVPMTSPWDDPNFRLAV